MADFFCGVWTHHHRFGAMSRMVGGLWSSFIFCCDLIDISADELPCFGIAGVLAGCYVQCSAEGYKTVVLPHANQNVVS